MYKAEPFCTLYVSFQVSKMVCFTKKGQRWSYCSFRPPKCQKITQSFCDNYHLVPSFSTPPVHLPYVHVAVNARGRMSVKCLQRVLFPANVTVVDAGGCERVKEHLKHAQPHFWSLTMPHCPSRLRQPPPSPSPHVPQGRKLGNIWLSLWERQWGRELVDLENLGEFFPGQCKGLLLSLPLVAGALESFGNTHCFT